MTPGRNHSVAWTASGESVLKKGRTETPRTLTVMREDPQICLERGGSVSGLDFLGGPLRCEAGTIHMGSRIPAAEGKIL